MAKLKASMLLAALLIVTLTVESKAWWLFGDKSKSDQDWKNEAEECVSELNNKKDPLGTAGWYKKAIDWLKNLEGAPTQSNCEDSDFAFHLVKFLTDKRVQKTHQFMNEYLELYLNKCGFDERFRKAIDLFEKGSQWRLGADEDEDEDLTLYGYLKRQPDLGPENFRRLLRAIEGDVNLDGESKDTECSEQKNSYLKNWFVNSRNYPDLRELVSDYCEVYLDKCGYERRFQQAIGKLKELRYLQWDSLEYSKLYGYLMVDFVGIDEVIDTLSLIYQIFKPISPSEELNCAQAHETKLLRAFFDSKDGTYFRKLVGYYVKHYLNKCGLESDFKKVIDYIKRYSEEDLHSQFQTLYTYVASYSIDLDRRSKDLDKDLPVLVIKELSKLVNNFERVDCTEMLGDNLLQLQDISEVHYYVRFLWEAYLGLYFDYCGFEERLKKTINRIEPIKHPLIPKPDIYPTLFDYFTLAPLDGMEIKRSALACVMLLFKVEDFSKETHCTNELINKLIQCSPEALSLFYSPLLGQIAFYFDKCGLEESFKAKFGIQKSSLFDYFYDLVISYDLSWQKHFMIIIGELSKSKRTQTDSDCSKKLIENLTAICNSPKYNSSLTASLKNRLAFYKGKCEEANSNASA